MGNMRGFIGEHNTNMGGDIFESILYRFLHTPYRLYKGKV